MAPVSSPGTAEHGALMDSVYRGQRHIYDATRKYYLFGRDQLIRSLDCPKNPAILEIACGTGRNLQLIAKRWGGCQYGLDISSEMLKSASARLGQSALLKQGDACAFDPQNLFGRSGFDRVVLSYSLSMIPHWQAALAQAAHCLAPGGSLHIVDFGDLQGLPNPVRCGLLSWLRKFHVEPRWQLAGELARIARSSGHQLTIERGPMGYYQRLRLAAPINPPAFDN